MRAALAVVVFYLGPCVCIPELGEFTASEGRASESYLLCVIDLVAVFCCFACCSRDISKKKKCLFRCLRLHPSVSPRGLGADETVQHVL